MYLLGEGQVYINRDWNIILYVSLSSGNIINEILFTKLNFKRKISNLNYAKPWILSKMVLLRISSSDMCDMWTKNKHFIGYRRIFYLHKETPMISGAILIVAMKGKL